ncbi:MAG: 50S ribosomal protein L23 [Pseudanabaenaceae cyanobacterium]
MSRLVPKEFDPRTLPDLIHKPIVNEKATRLLEENKYMFEVAKDATKYQIKAAIESLFEVKVTKVNTYNPPAVTKRVGKFVGKKSRHKRAIVTLAEGNKIDLFPDV